MSFNEYGFDCRNYNRTGKKDDCDSKSKLAARREIEKRQEQRELDALTDMNSPDYFA